jgi:TolB-like protein
MKSNKFLHFLFLGQFAGMLIFSGMDAAAAESFPLRLAIVPFSAPPGNGDIQKIAASASDLLMAGLSQDNRFQLVEREKVNAIWSELNLAESGFVSTDTVEKFGRVLSCDWLVSGSIVQVETNTEVWVKVIDVQSSVVLDLQSFPYNAANFSATISAISDFVAQINPHAQPRQFIALGNFVCQNSTPGHREWTQRLPALIEKHFLALGYGVVERSTVSPIFSEYQLETAGLTGDSTNRVRLKPAFWIVSGEYKYNVDATPERLDMILHMQKAGADEQFFFLNKPAGYEIEKALVDTIQSVLTKSSPMTLEQAQTGEANIRTAHIQELTKGRGERPIDPLYDTNTPSITVTDAYGGTRHLKIDPAWQAMKENHKNDMINSLEQAILLNPKDMRSKFLLGMALFGVSDAVDSKHGQDLLEEVAASGDATFATKAKNWLEDIRTGQLTFKHDQFGNLEIVTHDQPASFHANAFNVTTQQIRVLNDQGARSATTAGVADTLGNVVQIPSGPDQGTATNEQSEVEKRTEILQQNFSRFVPVQFQKGRDSMADIQYLHMKDNVFEYQGSYYCGFQFTVPEWIDGDFEWMYILAKTEANKDFSTSTLNWYIIPKNRRSEGFDDYWSGGFSGYIFLKAKFQYTQILTTQDLNKNRLKPGQTYAIWFSFKEKDMPDIAFAMTIKSNRGTNEFGALPLR